VAVEVIEDKHEDEAPADVEEKKEDIEAEDAPAV
jgi:hypothetical protein